MDMGSVHEMESALEADPVETEKSLSKKSIPKEEEATPLQNSRLKDQKDSVQSLKAKSSGKVSVASKRNVQSPEMETAKTVSQKSLDKEPNKVIEHNVTESQP